MYAGYGPYNLVDFTDDGTMTFEANPDYTWGPQPHVQTIVYSIIGDPTAAVQAMENEEIDIIQPQATADILTQLEGIADRGVEVIQDDGATYEHIDLAQNNGGPFDPAAYGGDAEKALAVRQAFLHAVPRQDIVDRLIIPLNENATVRNASPRCRVSRSTTSWSPRTAPTSTPRPTSSCPSRSSPTPASTRHADRRPAALRRPTTRVVPASTS